MATLMQATAPAVDPFDVSRAELYRDDTWHVPFAQLRAEPRSIAASIATTAPIGPSRPTSRS